MGLSLKVYIVKDFYGGGGVLVFEAEMNHNASQFHSVFTWMDGWMDDNIQLQEIKTSSCPSLVRIIKSLKVIQVVCFVFLVFPFGNLFRVSS